MDVGVKMKLAVVGSRTFGNLQIANLTILEMKLKRKQQELMYEEIDKYIWEYFWDDGLCEKFEIVSGGANGADRLAKEYVTSRQHGITYKEFPANWDLYGKSAGFKRNILIADYAEQCFAFVDKPLEESKGTANTVELFKQRNKPVKVFRF